MGRTACKEPQCLYKGALFFYTQNGWCAPSRVSCLLFSYPSNSAKFKRARNFENAELWPENEWAVRRDGNIRGCTNVRRSLYKAVSIIIRFKWQLRGLDSLLWNSLKSNSMKNPFSGFYIRTDGMTNEAGCEETWRGVGKGPSVILRSVSRIMPKDMAGRNRDNSGGGEIFRARPERLWGPPSSLHNGT